MLGSASSGSCPSCPRHYRTSNDSAGLEKWRPGCAMLLTYVAGPYGLHEGFGKRFRGPDFAEGLDGAMGVEGQRTHARYCMARCADTLTVEGSRGGSRLQSVVSPRPTSFHWRRILLPPTLEQARSQSDVSIVCVLVLIFEAGLSFLSPKAWAHTATHRWHLKIVTHSG